MKRRSAELEETLAQRLQPKLRMVANGDTEVNALRAKRCSAVALTPQQAAADDDQAAVATAASTTTRVRSSRLRTKLTQPADAIVSLFVQLDDDRVVEGLDQTPDGREGRGRHR